MIQTYVKCRNVSYPRDNVERQNVPDQFVPWAVPFPDYNPKNFTANGINGQPWADEELDAKVSETMNWNNIDERRRVDRRSFVNLYALDMEGFPLNPCGRTGLRGRGCLSRWGPNHATDPIVTRWKRIKDVIQTDPVDKKKILQFVAIPRRITHEWTIPGGMVDPGDVVSVTLRREFGEEALNTLQAKDADKKTIEKRIEYLFETGVEIYKGYVDDPRNTDNAWMETVAYNFHDEQGTNVALFDMTAEEDDAMNARWMDIHSGLALYASHAGMIRRVVERLNAHW